MNRNILFIILAFGVLFAAQNFDHCITIDDAGTYILTKDVEYTGSGSCIKITSNGVTVDCAGHSITGNYGATGIRIDDDVASTTLKDCEIDYFKYGIYIEEDTRTIEISGATIDSCDEGIVLEGGTNADIIDPYFTNTNVGVRLTNWYGGELSNGYFSTRDYGVYLTSTKSYTIHASEFTDSMYGVFTEGICTDTVISGSSFHGMATPIELLGSGSLVSGSTFYNNANYAIVVRAMNTFDGIRIHSQPLYIASQSSAFSMTDFTIGAQNTPASIHFNSFALRKPYTTTRYYYYNSSNFRIEGSFVSINPPEYAEPDMKGATVWLEDPGFESPALFTSDAKAYTTRSTVLMEGQMLGNAILESNAEGVIEFTLPVFEGAYAIGELPPEPEPEKVVSSVSITAPSEAEANTQITVAASDQNGEPLASAAVYYYHDFSEALLAGYTNSEGELPITIPEEGAFIIQVNYQGITSQRAISVYAPEPEEEPAPEPPAEEPSQEPPAPGQKGLDLSMLLPVAAALLILAAFAVAGGWFFFLRKPKAPDHEKPFKERLKKFRRE